VRMAAFQGMLNTAGDRAAGMILDALSGDDPDARSMAVGTGSDEGPDIASLSAGLSKLPRAGKSLARCPRFAARQGRAAGRVGRCQVG